MKNTHNQDSYTHILKYTSLFGGVQGLGILMGIVRNKLVAVILGPDGMGLVSLFNSTIKLLGDSTNFGISMSAVKNISEAYDHGDQAALQHGVAVVRLWSMLAALLGTVLCVVLSPWLSRFTFSWDGHTLHFVCLAPVVGMTALTGGELAIMKGTRRLKALAAVSVYGIVGALVVSVPLYWLFGQQAIVPSLLLLALLQLGLTLGFSYRKQPLRWHFDRSLMADGYSMIRLGVAFVVAGMLGSGADFIIRSYLSKTASLETLGLYNAAYMMTMTYVGMVFSAMETDYFPRLSGINHLGVTFNTTVNRQVEVMLLLVSPLLVAFMVSLPVLLPMLYSGRFRPALGMMQVVVLAMYLRALKLPVQYIPLAKGDSRSYLFLEAVCDVAMVAGVVTLFNAYGLTGAGFGILIMSIVDLLVTYVYTRWRYGYRPSWPVVGYTAMQLPFGLAAYALTFVACPWVYWSVGAVLAAGSLTVSLQVLKSKTHLWQSLTAKLKRKFGRP